MAHKHKSGHWARLPVVRPTAVAKPGDPIVVTQQLLKSICRHLEINGIRLDHGRDIDPVLATVEHRLEDRQVLRTEHSNHPTRKWNWNATSLDVEVKLFGREEQVERSVVPHQAHLFIAMGDPHVGGTVHYPDRQCSKDDRSLSCGDEYIHVDVASTAGFFSCVRQRERPT